MSKTINFSDLKRKTIYKLYDNGIEIYNPSPEQAKEILSIIVENVDEETNEIKINGKVFLTKLLGILTNIYIDTENEDLIQEIINDPSEELELVVSDITEIVKKITNKAVRNLNEISNMSENTIKLIMNEIENSNKKDEMTEDEIKQFQILQEKAKRKGLV